jgi:hypothetical protein
MTGGILADPSNGIQVKNTGCNFPFNFTYGASGAIRLVSNAVSVSGNLSAAVARLEAPLGNVAYTGSGVAPVISPINPEIVPTKPPSLTILSIGGYPVPSYSGSSFSSIDLLLPNQMADPIPVVVQGTNLPVGSPVAVNFSGSPNATSTATVYISNLNRAAVSYLFVSATFDPTLIAQYVPQKGPNAVSKIELAAAIAQKTQYRFFRLDGSQVPFDRVSAQLRHALGF